jgi:hypothetical protein
MIQNLREWRQWNGYVQIQQTTANPRLNVFHLPKRIRVTTAERRRLVKFGRGLGSAIQQLVTILSPRTFFRWLAADDGKPTTMPAKTGRPRIEPNLPVLPHGQRCFVVHEFLHRTTFAQQKRHSRQSQVPGGW